MHDMMNGTSMDVMGAHGGMPGSGPAMALVPLDAATHMAVASGDWSDPSTWADGAVPTDGARIVIPEGLTVRVDGALEPALKTVRIDGVLTFRTDVDTALNVDTLVSSTTGVLEIGRAENPIAAGVTAVVTFADDGPIDPTWDPNLLSRGALLHGQTTIYGAETTAFTTVETFPLAGDTTLTLASAPSGWNVGDTLVVAGVDPSDPTTDEVVTIAAIDGNLVTLDQALERDHAAPRADLDVHVANLTRNVQFTSANDGALQRGHVMFMHTNNVDVNYVSFDDLGRSDKVVGLDDWVLESGSEDSIGSDNVEVSDLGGTNVRGRYSVHFHRGGAEGPAATVNGAVVTDDPSWAFTNHSSNVNFTNNVSHNIGGAAYVTEAGDEVGSFVGNIALRTVNPEAQLNPTRVEVEPEREPDARAATQDYGFQGDGFWLHGAGVTVDDNVVAGASGHAYIYWTLGLVEENLGEALVDVAQLPNGDLIGPDGTLVRTKHVPVPSFDGNEAYNAAKGLQIHYLHTDHRDSQDRQFAAEGILAEVPQTYEDQLLSTFSDLTIWNVNLSGVDAPYTSRVVFDGLDLTGTGQEGSFGVALDHFANQHSLTLSNSTIQGFEVGVAAPRQGVGLIDSVTLANLTDILILAPDVDPRNLTIRDVTFAPLSGPLEGQEGQRTNYVLNAFEDADFSGFANDAEDDDAFGEDELGHDGDGFVEVEDDAHDLADEEEDAFDDDDEHESSEDVEDLGPLTSGVTAERGDASDPSEGGFATPVYAPYILPDRIVVESAVRESFGLYFNEQAASFTPFEVGSELAGLLPEGVAGLTNEQLLDQYGVVWGGNILPADAVRAANVEGGFVGAPAPTYGVFPPPLDPQFILFDANEINPATGQSVDEDAPDAFEDDDLGEDGAEADGGDVTIAFLGDSITDAPDDASFVEVLSEQAREDAELMNFAVGGAGITPEAGEARIQDLEAYQELIDSEADIVWVMIGGNDVNFGGTPESYEAALRVVVADIAAMPSEPQIIVAAQPPFFALEETDEGSIYASGQDAHDAFRADWIPVMQRVAEETGATFIDINAQVTDYPANYPDTLHPNAEGAANLAGLVGAALEPVVDAIGPGDPPDGDDVADLDDAPNADQGPSDFEPTDVFAFENDENGAGFLTIEPNERDAILDLLPQFNFEGAPFQAFAADAAAADGPGGLEEVYRFFNSHTGGHFFTASEAERDAVMETGLGFTYEGVSFAAFAEEGHGTVPVQRIFNMATGVHDYVADAAALATLLADPDARDEGVAFHSVAALPPDGAAGVSEPGSDALI